MTVMVRANASIVATEMVEAQLVLELLVHLLVHPAAVGGSGSIPEGVGVSRHRRARLDQGCQDLALVSRSTLMHHRHAEARP